MARPTKIGLDYFPMDVNAFDDDKLQLIAAEFGAKGELIYIKLLCKIYKTGYFYKWGEDEALLFAKSVGNGVTGSLVSEIVQGCIKRCLFDKAVFDAFKILTSKGIQERYQFICKGLKRNFEIDEKFDCRNLTKLKREFSPEITPIITEEIAKATEESTQRKRKERKVKEMKEKTIENSIWMEQSCMTLDTDEKTLLKFCNDWIAKALIQMKFENYPVNSLISFMVKDFEQPKKVAITIDSTLENWGK